MFFKVGLVLRRQRSTVLSLAAFFLLAGLLAGCGGNGGTGSGSQNGGENGGDGDAGGGAGGGGAGGDANNATETKIALGRIVSVKPDNGKIVLRKVGAGDQGGERMVFKVKKNAQITLDDKQVELADAKEGQQAQIGYVVSEEQTNLAKTVELFASDGGTG